MSASADIGDNLDAVAADFMAVRPRLFAIAYRMLGSAAEADDVLQDVWLRWQSTDRGVVQNSAAFLTTITTRLAVNVVQSARVRRETYIGPWLPEPIVTESDPAVGVENDEAVQMAVLVLLERLPARERAAYVLREAFDYRYSDGGGKARLAARVPVGGRSRVAQFVAAFASHFWDQTELAHLEVNGSPAVVVTDASGIKALLTVSASVEGIDQVMWVMNPDKLIGLTRPQQL